jgi:acetyl/propionyl-CoA carboxylase alpha subunit/acetyl-CoA carboxylase carboxyltransferase component
VNTRDSIHRLAIVNRGEAAMRCIRAVKSLRAQEGSRLSAVALYTGVDRDAPFVRHADLAVELPVTGSEAAAYLDHDLLIETLHRADADAVWPGWGFVAEDPVFVERLTSEGICFLGPSADALHVLGDKIAAKRLAESAKVPVMPWSDVAVADPEEARIAAEEIGYPVVIKARAGGGGRGIRIVDEPGALSEAFRSAAAEAQASFGDGGLFLEKRIESGRHVEVQIAGDRGGIVLALGCRECSVQRRHQKLLEEAPPPGLSEALLESLQEAAIRIAAMVKYEGLGTVEFLVTGSGYYFLEMNPRLQVEHGVTEEVTGSDLVRLQIQIARGESLSYTPLRQKGVAIEARVCAEDAEAGFAPAPGRIVRFDPAFGPGIRIDTGVATGSVVPAAFDSLIAKVIASGETREEARARLVCALSDFDLVIEGGATNKGYLAEILDDPEFRSGGVDTGWLDRFAASRAREGDHAVDALIAAGILSYQRARAAVQLNFYADPSTLTPQRIPPSRGQQIDLTYGGEHYRLQVFAIGSWRYRVHLEGRVVATTLRDERAHAARLQIGERTLRLLYDATEVGLRVEVEGHAYRFGSQAAGHVRASTPAMVVSIDVEPGDRVTAGQSIGLLEAMKVEIGFDAPVTGVVTEVRVRKGQQVAAGDVLLVIDSSGEEDSEVGVCRRLQLRELRDPLERLFGSLPGGSLGEPDLLAADRAAAEDRRSAIEAVREEVRRVLLGYDADRVRSEHLSEFLEAPLPDRLSDEFRRELADVRHELVLFADVARLSVRSPRASVSGELGPSNSARLRRYVRRVRAGGTGIVEEFLELVSAALAHYGITSLEPSDALERAVLRMLAAQLPSQLRDRLVLGLLSRVTALARSGVQLRADRKLAAALRGIAGMRGGVSHAVADAAVEASYVIFQRPETEREAERTSEQVETWLAAVESQPTAPPQDVLRHLADAPRGIFDRVGGWLADSDPRRAIALAAHLRRAYSPSEPTHHVTSRQGGIWIDRLEFPGLRTVLGGAAAPREIGASAARLLEAAERERDSHEWPAVQAIELFVPLVDGRHAEDLVKELEPALAGGLPSGRFTLNLVRPGGPDFHRTFVPTQDGFREDGSLQQLHPEAARRIDLERLGGFELSRIPGSEGIYCFHGRSCEVPGDERIFVLADLRSRSPDNGREADLHIAAFEHAFYEATRSLRAILTLRDPKRRLQWNRIVIFVAPEIFLDRDVAEQLANRLAPATRHLGLEKVVVQLKLLDREAPDRAAEEIEIVISDITGSQMNILWRAPRRSLLLPRSEYERKVVEARRRRLVYPYEIIRMLTGSSSSNGGSQRAGLPAGRFEEYDLDPEAKLPLLRCVSGRPYGVNSSSVVFGIIETPTAKVPEGMRRVLVLSDPTLGMGSLAGAECDRLVAAMDLAEQNDIPLEWVPVSSGARIAMDSGTENLDATARVARRIITFTQAGGTIHVIVPGVNVGAQSYFDALATMLVHTRGALIMTPGASMVLTGRAALEASGGVSAEDETAIGGFERIMGPNGEAQYYATGIADAYRILYEHYRYTYVVPGESGPRRHPTMDDEDRPILDDPCQGEFENVGEIFDDVTNPGRKRPFPMRAVMEAVIDRDGGHLERWRSMVGAEMAIVWDAHLGGQPVCLIGIESQNVTREGYRPLDGPVSWSGGTLFPLSSKKVARALNAASGNRAVVVLANLSGFDGSPESMRKLQLEYGAEIARAVVNFEGPIIFLVVSRYHGGAYVVFSRALNPRLRASALTGSFASVIGGGPAAAVVFSREVRARAMADPRVRALRERLRSDSGDDVRGLFERTLGEVILQEQAVLAAEFDAVHSVDRAREVGSIEEIVDPAQMRAFLIRSLRAELSG